MIRSAEGSFRNASSRQLCHCHRGRQVSRIVAVLQAEFSVTMGGIGQSRGRLDWRGNLGSVREGHGISGQC